ncbi:SET domain-containing protein [Trametopsis cervina]|nr:SET domain-containing protein [Trametopsis cervina]
MTSAIACRVVDVPGKGKGLVASRFLPRGSLIVSERPLIQLPRGFGVFSDIGEYASQPAVEKLMTFPGDPESPFSSRTKHFLPMVGSDQYISGLFEIICRANHSCRPNANYYWNNVLGKEVLHAILDIEEGSEIEVNYVADERAGSDRRAYLESAFGFTCMCSACVRPFEERMQVATRVRQYLEFVEELPSWFGSKPPMWILNKIEEYTIAACKDGLLHDIAARCHDAFQLCAYYGDATHAAEWEAISRDEYTVRNGRDEPAAARARRLAAHPQEFRAWAQLGRRKLKGPSDALKKWAYPKSTAWPGSATANAVVVTTTTTPATTPEQVSPPTNEVKLSKGQKKKLREKKKKVAGLSEV